MQQEIIKKIRKLRIEKGISKQEMASRLSIDLSAYNKLESGKANTWGKYFGEILTILEINPSRFFNGIQLTEIPQT
jgi:transcriptional regulator with XRE-family HTH domain